jgi:hypothetical protein
MATGLKSATGFTGKKTTGAPMSSGILLITKK